MFWLMLVACVVMFVIAVVAFVYNCVVFGSVLAGGAVLLADQAARGGPHIAAVSLVLVMLISCAAIVEIVRRWRACRS